MGREDLTPSPYAVLVVDDTQANLRLYGRLLEKSGFAVRTAPGGAEALAALQAEVPSLVLLDYMMPGINGIDVLRSIRKNAATLHLPVVMLTASAAPDHIDLALEEGANDYITKPVNGKVLIARVRAILQMATARANQKRPDAEQALWDELDEAARVQEAQLPHVPFKAEGLEVSGAVIPCGKVGGDLFDIFADDEGRYLCTLLDVAGHGTASALVAAETRALLRSMLERRPPGAALFRVNQSMVSQATGKFCCTGVAEIVGRRATIVNAGLPPILVLRGSEVVRSVSGGGAPLGMFEDSVYEEECIDLEPGDRIVLLSDGLTEPWGRIDKSHDAITRLGLLPSMCASLPTPAELRELMQCPAPTAGNDDDRTVLILEIPPLETAHHAVPANLSAIGGAVQVALREAPPWVDLAALDHGLTEALTNAIVHGVFGLYTEGRENGDFESYLALAESSSEASPDKTVDLLVRKEPGALGIHLRWSGTACPPEAREPNPASTPTVTHDDLLISGMGSRIIYSLFDEVSWDDDGFGVWLRFLRPTSLCAANLFQARSLAG